MFDILSNVFIRNILFLERERLSKLAQEGLRVKAELIQRGKEIR